MGTQRAIVKELALLATMLPTEFRRQSDYIESALYLQSIELQLSEDQSFSLIKQLRKQIGQVIEELAETSKEIIDEVQKAADSLTANDEFLQSSIKENYQLMISNFQRIKEQLK